MIVATLAATAGFLAGSTVPFAPQRTVEPVVQMVAVSRRPPVGQPPSSPPLTFHRSDSPHL